MKKSAVILLFLLTAGLLCGCGKDGKTEQALPPETDSPMEAEPAFSESPEKEKVLVVCFAPGEETRGNTLRAAEIVTEMLDSDLYEIRATDGRYDVDEETLAEIAKKEADNKVRPAIAGPLPRMEDYDTVFLCAPAMEGEWPMILLSFMEGTDLSDKKLSALIVQEEDSSDFVAKLKQLCPYSVVTEGLSLSRDLLRERQQTAEAKIRFWLNRLSYEI